MDKEKVAPLSWRQNPLSIAGRIAVLIVFALGCFAIKAEAQVFRIDPSVLVSEEYNDNVFLQGRGNERVYAYITRLAPSVRVRYNTSFWDWDINYTYNYYYYLYKHSTNLHEQDQTHTLSARNRTEFIKDTLFLEVRDEYSRVSQDVVVDNTQQSPSRNQVDQNIFTINPYAIFRPSLNTRAVFGYIFQETKYLNASGNNQDQYVNRDDNIGYGEAGIDLSSRLTFTTGARYTDERNNLLNFEQVDVYAGPRYTYAENCFLFARGGKTWFRFETNPNTGEKVSDREYWFWDVGISHRMTTITLALNARRFVAQDPERAVTLEDQYTASVTKTAPRYVLMIGGGWSEYRDAVIDQRIATSEQVQGSVLYRFTPTTTGTLGAGFQDVNQKTTEGGVGSVGNVGVTWITLATLRFDHQLSEKATMALEYRYTNSQSYDIQANNYYNNRYIIEYRHAF